MIASPKPRRVVVIGAGIFGVSSALHLARLDVDDTIVNGVGTRAVRNRTLRANGT